MPPALSVVMPAHNEALLLRASVSDVAAGLRARGEEFELIIVENGSSDNTRDLAVALTSEEPEVVVRTLARADYGEAIRDGILAARGEIVVLFDVDYYDLGFLDRARQRLVSPAGDGRTPAVVVGSKRAPGTSDHRPWPRRAVTAAFATILRLGFGLTVSDTHGMKIMRREVVVDLARRCHTGADLFDTELVLRVERAGYDVAELPVSVRELRPSRTPIIRRAVRTVWGLLTLRVILWRERPAPDRATC